LKTQPKLAMSRSTIMDALVPIGDVDDASQRLASLRKSNAKSA
jgi:hypothetical protein